MLDKAKITIKDYVIYRALNYSVLVGLGSLGVTCSPWYPRFAGSNPAEMEGYFSGRKNPEHMSSGREFKLGSRV